MQPKLELLSVDLLGRDDFGARFIKYFRNNEARRAKESQPSTA